MEAVAGGDDSSPELFSSWMPRALMPKYTSVLYIHRRRAQTLSDVHLQTPLPNAWLAPSAGERDPVDPLLAFRLFCLSFCAALGADLRQQHAAHSAFFAVKLGRSPILNSHRRFNITPHAPE